MSALAPARLAHLHVVLAEAGAAAAAHRYAPATAAYEAVRAELAALPPRDEDPRPLDVLDVDAALLHARAAAGIAWVAEREGRPEARPYRITAHALATIAVDRCSRAGAGDGWLAACFETRGGLALDLGEGAKAFEDLAEAEALLAASPWADRTRVRAEVERAAALLAASGLRIPPRCLRCGRTAATTSTLLARHGSAVCPSCVVDLGDNFAAMPIRPGASCVFCLRADIAPRVVTASTCACGPCLRGMRVVLAGGEDASTCVGCGRVDERRVRSSGGAVDVCARCVAVGLAQVDAGAPRVRARKRAGHDRPPSRFSARCVCCGTVESLAMARLPSDHLMCVECMDTAEAQLRSSADDSDGAAPASDETAPGSASTSRDELEALARARPDLLAACVLRMVSQVDQDELDALRARLLDPATPRDTTFHLALADVEVQRGFLRRQGDALPLLEEALAVSRAATASGAPAAATEAAAVLLLVAQLARAGRAVEGRALLGEGLALLGTERYAATPYLVGRLTRRLGDLLATVRPPDAIRAYRRAMESLRFATEAGDERAPAELAATAINLGNLDLEASEDLYGEGADAFERMLDRDVAAVSDFTIALENRSRRRTRRGDHEGALTDLERALDGALGGLAIHGEELRARATELEAMVAAARERCAETVARAAAATGLTACSFCGKSQREVRKIIKGERAFVCDECLGLCNDIHAEAGLDRSTALHAFPNGATCSFCESNEGRQLVTGPDGVAICDECVAGANDIIAAEAEDA